MVDSIQWTRNLFVSCWLKEKRAKMGLISINDSQDEPIIVRPWKRGHCKEREMHNKKYKKG